MIVYSAKTSLNGCVRGAIRDLALCESPPREMNAFVNEQERTSAPPLRTPAIRGYAVRETLDDDEPITKEYVQIRRAADKVVFRER